MDLSTLEAIVFDFDGVLTDNRVYVGETGQEMVCCNRADGLAFDALRATRLQIFIVSTEANRVVEQRAAKLQVTAFCGSCDKRATLLELANRYGFALSRTLFVGNDLNDLEAMRACGASTCPADSHPAVLQAATFRLQTRGGCGVVRELAEEILKLPVSGIPAGGASA